ncbi:hypothetical protein [Streptomyces sp. NPDC058066]|uniref:hypothetical protein n=1 Tax=Streptomyces sp. NPDC058066 TaxID=3346323 RepID=UPI0036E13885
MFRIIVWSLIAAYLLAVGIWPSAAAPVGLAFAGLGVVLTAIPAPVIAVAAALIWLRHRTPQSANA